MKSVVDANRLVQTHRVVMLQTTAESVSIVMENCHVKVCEVTTKLDISHGSAHHITHKMVKFQKVFAR